jgi:hypothetical protein
VSSEAGTRFDTNQTGYRAETELGWTGEPLVRTGAVQKILGLSSRNGPWSGAGEVGSCLTHAGRRRRADSVPPITDSRRSLRGHPLVCQNVPFGTVAIARHPANLAAPPGLRSPDLRSRHPLSRRVGSGPTGVTVICAARHDCKSVGTATPAAGMSVGGSALVVALALAIRSRPPGGAHIYWEHLSRVRGVAVHRSRHLRDGGVIRFVVDR